MERRPAGSSGQFSGMISSEPVFSRPPEKEGREEEGGRRWTLDRRRVSTRAVEITYNVISDQDQVQAIYFDLRSDQGQIIFVIFLPYEKIKIS